MWDDKEPLTDEEIARLRKFLSYLPIAYIYLEPAALPPAFARPAFARPAYLLAALGWLCAFGILLAAVFGMVQIDGITISGFIFSLLIALGASASGSAATKKPGGA